MNDGTTARFVVGNPASLTPDDQLLFDELDSEGYDIVLVDDDAAASAPSGTALIVIGPSTSGASLGGKYELTAAPILIFASSAWDSMGLTETDGAVADTSTLAWVDASHPIADLLPSPVKVTPSVEPMRSMAAVNLADGAVPVATRANNANANVVFTIDTGAPWPTAPQRVLLAS